MAKAADEAFIDKISASFSLSYEITVWKLVHFIFKLVWKQWSYRSINPILILMFHSLLVLLLLKNNHQEFSSPRNIFLDNLLTKESSLHLDLLFLPTVAAKTTASPIFSNELLHQLVLRFFLSLLTIFLSCYFSLASLLL